MSLGGAISTNKSKAVQTNTPGWSTAPETADIGALRGMVGGGDYQTPIRNQYARAEKQMSESYNNPLGAYTTADVRDKSIREQKLDMQQSLGMDLSNAAQQNADAKFNRQATVAGMTAPQFYMAQHTKENKMVPMDWVNMALGTAGGMA